jgi:hypothetical protein
MTTSEIPMPETATPETPGTRTFETPTPAVHFHLPSHDEDTEEDVEGGGSNAGGDGGSGADSASAGGDNKFKDDYVELLTNDDEDAGMDSFFAKRIRLRVQKLIGEDQEQGQGSNMHHC